MSIKFIQSIKEEWPEIITNRFDVKFIEIEKGIVFLYCEWSPIEPVFTNLLEIYKTYTEIPFYVFDIDKEEFTGFSLVNNVKSHGWGEMYWIKNGEVISKILKYNSVDDIAKASKYTQVLAKS
jgi:hypothetical protein